KDPELASFAMRLQGILIGMPVRVRCRLGGWFFRDRSSNPGCLTFITRNRQEWAQAVSETGPGRTPCGSMTGENPSGFLRLPPQDRLFDSAPSIVMKDRLSRRSAQDDTEGGALRNREQARTKPNKQRVVE